LVSRFGFRKANIVFRSLAVKGWDDVSGVLQRFPIDRYQILIFRRRFQREGMEGILYNPCHVFGRTFVENCAFLKREFKKIYVIIKILASIYVVNDHQFAIEFVFRLKTATGGNNRGKIGLKRQRGIPWKHDLHLPFPKFPISD
jgi:hypothetical protein